MIEGWYNDDYLVLFEEQIESIRLTEAYGIRKSLPGFAVAGLRGWDDFIVRDQDQRFYTVPTVPAVREYLAPFQFPVDLAAIKPDPRFTKKVKWYVKPIVFGGDPKVGENLTWISIEQHTEAVRSWNQIYRDVARNVANKKTES